MMRRRHGDSVQVEFCDVDDAEVRGRWQDVIAQAEREGWDTPYADVDGRLTPLESLDTWVIVDLVENSLAKRKAQQQPN